MREGEWSIGFLGCGQMAQALAGGMVAARIVAPERILGSDPVDAARVAFQQRTGGGSATSNIDVVRNCDVLFLAVKPQSMAELLAEIAPAVDSRHLIVSIAAGLRIETLAAALGPKPRLVRVMPNTPCLVRASASAFSLGERATAADGALVRTLLEAVGIAVEVPEKLLDAVTGLSGSGPAFVYLAIEALADGGVKAGLPRTVATTLAAQTVMGAAKLVLETKRHPGELKDAVASPAGTTIAGLSVLESRGVRGAFIEAVDAAARRAAELG